jgi:hypothetical protein
MCPTYRRVQDRAKGKNHYSDRGIMTAHSIYLLKLTTVGLLDSRINGNNNNNNNNLLITPQPQLNFKCSECIFLIVLVVLAPAYVFTYFL